MVGLRSIRIPLKGLVTAVAKHQEECYDQLDSLGWDSMKNYQKWAGLKDDGDPGPVTKRHLFQPRLCGNPDVMAIHDVPCQWPRDMPFVTWGFDDSLLNAPVFQQVKEAAAWACQQWNEACGINLVYTDNTYRNILLTQADLGGAGGTLADSMLPCTGPTAASQMRQRYDSTEPWHLGDWPIPDGRVSFRLVCMHELGHAIGMEHLPPGGPTAVMQPIYNDRLSALQPADMAGVIARYGEAEGSDPVDPPDGENGLGLFRLSFVVRGAPVVEAVDIPLVETVGPGAFGGGGRRE